MGERVDGNVTIELPWATTVDLTQSKSHAPILERGLSMKLSGSYRYSKLSEASSHTQPQVASLLAARNCRRDYHKFAHFYSGHCGDVSPRYLHHHPSLALQSLENYAGGDC